MSNLDLFLTGYLHAVIGYQRDSYVNYARLNDFLRNVSYSFKNDEKATDVLSQKKLSKGIFNSEFCYNYDQLLIEPRPLRARPILKLLARLLPKLYSTRSCYYYKSVIQN